MLFLLFFFCCVKTLSIILNLLQRRRSSSGAKSERMLDLRGVCNSMPMTSHEFTIKLMAFSHQKRWQCREKFSRISEWKFYWFSKAEILSLLTLHMGGSAELTLVSVSDTQTVNRRRCRLGREGQAWGALRRVLMAETWNLLPPPSYFFVLLSTFGLLVCLSLHCLSRFQRHIHKMWTFSEGRDNERSWVNIWLFLMSICTASKVSSSFLVSVCLECGEIEILRFHRFECRWAHVYGFLFVFRLL